MARSPPSSVKDEEKREGDHLSLEDNEKTKSSKASVIEEEKKNENDAEETEERNRRASEKFTPYSLSFSLNAFEKRDSNGLRHLDYLRYRQFCSRHLHRLRSRLEMKQGRHRYSPKPLPMLVRDERVFFLVQMQAERAWSYGMQLKGENAASAVIDPRVRAHALRRFSKAVSYARLLEELCHSHTPSLLHPSLPDFKSTPSSSSALSHDKEVEKSSSSSPSSSPPAGETSGTSTKLLGNESSSSTSQSSPSSSTGAGHATKMKGKEKSFFLFSREERDGFLSSLGCNLVSLCDEKTCLDAKAYRMSLEALLLQEKEDWREASERLQELQQVYIHLKRVSSTHEKEEKLFKHLLSSIEPQLRLCAFHSGGVASFAASMTTATQAGRKKREEEEEGDSSSLSSSTTRKSLRLSGSGSSAMKKKASPSSGTAGSHEEEEEGEPSSSSFGIWWRGEELRAKRGNEKIRSAVLMAQKTIPQTVLLDDTEMSRLLDEEEKIWGTSKEKIHKKGKKGDEEEEEEVEGNSSLEEKILSMLSQEKSTASVVERYGELSNRFRLCVDLIHTEMIRQPDDTSLYSVEGYCLDRSRSLVVERDGFLLLRFLLSLKRHDEKAETGSGILYRASRHPVASSTSQAGDAGTRYASLLQQGVSKMLDEEGLDEERKLRMQHWAKVAKDARALCLAVWFGVSANKAAEAYVLASAVASRSKPLTRQSKLMPIDDPHGRLDILFCLLERLTSCLAHCYEARMLAAIVRENLKTSGVLEEGEASQHLPTAIAGAMQKSTPRDRHSRQPKGTQLSSTVGGRYILPAFEPLPVKPFLFDLALQSYEAPDLRHRIAGGETGTGGKREAIRGFVKSLFWKS